MTAGTLNAISLVNLRKSLGDIVNRVSFAQERTTISKNGKTVAALIPVEDLDLLEKLEAQADLMALRQAREEDDGARISLEDFLAGKEI